MQVTHYSQVLTWVWQEKCRSVVPASGFRGSTNSVGLRPILGLVWGSEARFGAILGVWGSIQWGLGFILGPFRPILGGGGVWGPFWGLWGLVWGSEAHFGTFWSYPGGLRVDAVGFGFILGDSRAILGPFGPSLGAEAHFGAFWVHSGQSKGHFGAVLGVWGSIHWGSRLILGSFGQNLGGLWVYPLEFWAFRDLVGLRGSGLREKVGK